MLEIVITNSVEEEGITSQTMPDELKMIQSSTLWAVIFHTAASRLSPIAQNTIQHCCLYFHNRVITCSC